MFFILILTCCVIIPGAVQGGRMMQGFGGTLQDWGNVTTRDGASMFWWLYFVDPPQRPTDFDVYSRPLIVWVEGGPGDGGTGFGNFLQIGPLDIDGVTRRNTTWVKDHNVLFIDAPAGAGFSYVPDTSKYTLDDNDVVMDVVNCLMNFFDGHEKFRTVPMYIFGHSYGGKIAVLLAELLIEKPTLFPTNLKGVGLSSPFICPIDTILHWGTYHYNMGYLDAAQRTVVDELAGKCQTQAEKKKWAKLFDSYGVTFTKLVNFTKFMNVENLSVKTPPRAAVSRNEIQVDEFMNNKVKPVLGVTTKFGEQAANTFFHFNNTLLKNVVSTVKKLVKASALKVVVFGGQMDGIVSLTSIEAWVNRVFNDDKLWSRAPRIPLLIDDLIQGYEKQYKRFRMYWILGAGHMVARNNPEAVRVILTRLTGQ